MIVTTHEFTKDAKKLTEDLRVKAIDGQELAKMITALNAHDLLQNYTVPDFPGDSPDDGESVDIDETHSEEEFGVVTRFITKRNRFNRIVATTVLQGLALGWLYFAESYPNVTPTEHFYILSGSGAIVASYVFLDATRQQLLDQSYTPRAYLWAACALVIPILHAAVYCYRRYTTNSSK